MGAPVKDFEPVMPAEAAQALFKCSDGNVIMKGIITPRGWERALFCEHCNKTQSVEALILLERNDEAAFARILDFCRLHRHSEFGRYERVESATVPLDSGRRIKDI